METRQQTSNGFSAGLMMDYNPEGTPNNAVTNALNATLITYNGNENMLQNDMGNARVETAFLPEGFIPVGTCSFGGIVYIASTNPLTGVSQLGSFPSPERNFGLGDETTGKPGTSLNDNKVKTSYGFKSKTILPLNETINVVPGDKFYLCISENDMKNMYGYVNHILRDGIESDEIPTVELAIGVQQDGNVKELAYLKKYDTTIEELNQQGQPENHVYRYFFGVFKGEEMVNPDGSIEIDAYRSVVSSPYQVVTGSFSGQLCIIVKLMTIDNFNIQYNAQIAYS